MGPADFSVRNKYNGAQHQPDEARGGNISYRGFVHTFNALVPPERYFADHPEYYSEINGARVGPDHSQLCLTNPDVLRIATQTVRQWIKESPNASIISVSQNDWHNYCQCEKCSALAEKEGSQAGPLLHFVNAIAESYAMPVIYSTHPRSRAFIDKRGFVFHPLVRSLKPFGFFDYNKLQLNAYCVLSDSGTVPEEASILGFPAVSVRTSTERPEALEKGAFVLGGVKKDDILQAVELARSMWEHGEPVSPVADYAETNVSVKVIKVIQSYTKVVNKVVWGK